MLMLSRRPLFTDRGGRATVRDCQDSDKGVSDDASSLFIHCPDGATLEFTIVELRGQVVRVGIVAPQEYQIVRKDAGPRKEREVLPDDRNQA